MKPLGLGFVAHEGGIGLALRRPTSTEDKVWEAVQDAILAGWTPKQFLAEVRGAWAHELAERAKADDEEFTK